jgi:hypothetical protein
MNRELSRVAHLRTARPLVARVAAIHRLMGAKVFAAERKEHPTSGPITRFHRSEGVSRLPAANP